LEHKKENKRGGTPWIDRGELYLLAEMSLVKGQVEANTHKFCMEDRYLTEIK